MGLGRVSETRGKTIDSKGLERLERPRRPGDRVGVLGDGEGLGRLKRPRRPEQGEERVGGSGRQ